MWTIFKVFVEFVTLLLHFIFWFFSREAYGILASQPGSEHAPAALKGRVWTTGLSGKSLSFFYVKHLPFIDISELHPQLKSDQLWTQSESLFANMVDILLW